MGSTLKLRKTVQNWPASLTCWKEMGNQDIKPKNRAQWIKDPTVEARSLQRGRFDPCPCAVLKESGVSCSSDSVLDWELPYVAGSAIKRNNNGVEKPRKTEIIRKTLKFRWVGKKSHGWVRDSHACPHSDLPGYIFWFWFFFFFFGLPIEVPGKGSDSSPCCDLCCSCIKAGSFNPLCLCWARDQTCVLELQSYCRSHFSRNSKTWVHFFFP